ncbi:energy transducer TonB [Sphingomonas gei]|uniref:energy transducer TonB n=1 Tax=Sphingomonas gei TaxID=1395960 RepID=UPI001442A18F|nr:energy transducer TonB [Sphingomonas gei]
MIATLVLALAVFFWIGSNSSVPVAQAARNTVLTVFNIPQAARPDHPEQVPPGPRQRQSEAQRAASREPTPVPIQPVPPAGGQSAPATPPPAPSAAAASANSSGSKQVERTTAPPAMPVPVSTVSAAQEDVAAQAAAAKADWQARLLGHLRKYRRYPRSAESSGQQGVATIAITLNRQGRVLNVQLRRGSGYPLLDTEAVATARRGSPLPAPDAAIPGDPVRVEVPVVFSLARPDF